MIFLGPPVTQQRRYEWQRSLATQSEYMVDSVITHANKTASTVYWKCLLCSSLWYTAMCAYQAVDTRAGQEYFVLKYICT